MKKSIYIVIVLVLLGVILFLITLTKNENIVEAPVEASSEKYVIYRNGEGDLEFIYPESWLNVNTKEGNKICPEEDTYRTGDTLHIFDEEFTFEEIKLPDSDSMVRIGIRTYELDPKNLNDCGDDFHQLLAEEKVLPESLSSFRLDTIALSNGLRGTFNPEASRLNTESRKQYTFFIPRDSKTLIVQAYFSFVPYFGSRELIEMEEKYDGDMEKYLLEGKTAENIRKHMQEFQKMVADLKLTSNNL